MTTLAIAIPCTAEAPPRIDRGAGEPRFGFERARRRAFFDEIARQDERWRAIAERAFPGDAWAQADHWSDHLAAHVRKMARRDGVSLVPILLSLDEGIHEDWRGPNGEPLRVSWPPLSERRRR